MTANKGMNKFTIRGQEKVKTQWQIYCLVHTVPYNDEKLRNSLH
nr:transposase [uncultured Psychromonas sp.]